MAIILSIRCCERMRLLILVLVLVCLCVAVSLWTRNTPAQKEHQAPQLEGIIGFNVRGQIFQTTKQTVLRYARSDSYLVQVMYGNTPVPLDAHGNFFLDRNPQCFELLLDFMQHGFWDVSVWGVSTQRLQEDLEFYGIATYDFSCGPNRLIADKLACKKTLAAREERRSHVLPLIRAIVANTTTVISKMKEQKDFSVLYIPTTEAQFEDTIRNQKNKIVEFREGFTSVNRLFVPEVSVFITDPVAWEVLKYELQVPLLYPKLYGIVPDLGHGWLQRGACQQIGCIAAFIL